MAGNLCQSAKDRIGCDESESRFFQLPASIMSDRTVNEPLRSLAGFRYVDHVDRRLFDTPAPRSGFAAEWPTTLVTASATRLMARRVGQLIDLVESSAPSFGPERA